MLMLSRIFITAVIFLEKMLKYDFKLCKFFHTSIRPLLLLHSNFIGKVEIYWANVVRALVQFRGATALSGGQGRRSDSLPT